METVQTILEIFRRSKSSVTLGLVPWVGQSLRGAVLVGLLGCLLQSASIYCIGLWAGLGQLWRCLSLPFCLFPSLLPWPRLSWPYKFWTPASHEVVLTDKHLQILAKSEDGSQSCEGLEGKEEDMGEGGAEAGS